MSNLVTIAEVYVENALVKNTSSINFEQLRNFIDIQYTYDEDKTNAPTTKDLTFSLDGNLDTADASHLTFLDIPKEPISIEYYPGGKTKGFGWGFDVYVEKCSANATAGDVVKFNASFKKAGPVIKL